MVSSLEFEFIDWPDRAGRLQRDGATASLVAELGDNYSKYHSFLAARLARFGKRPEVGDFGSTDEYYAAWAEIQEILHAEVVLRGARRFRREGGPLDFSWDVSRPLVGSDDRLVPAE